MWARAVTIFTSRAIVDDYFDKKVAFETVRRAQLPVTVITCEAVAGRHDVVACNDTRSDLPIEYEIRDADTDVVLLHGTAEVPGDAVIRLGSIPGPAGQAMLLLSWRSDAIGVHRSHYLAGTPPFDLDRYRAWMGRAYGEPGPAR